MIRVHFITTLILSFLLMIITVVLFFYVKDLRHGYYNSALGTFEHSTNFRPHLQASRFIGLFLALIFSYYIFVFIYGFIKSRHTAILVLGILGILFTALAILIDLVMVMDRSTTFDEVGPVFTVWAFFMLAFTIPCAILSGKKQLADYHAKKEMEKLMFSNPMQWQAYHLKMKTPVQAEDKVSGDSPADFFRSPDFNNNNKPN